MTRRTAQRNVQIARLRAEGMSLAELSKQYGISKQAISFICHQECVPGESQFVRARRRTETRLARNEKNKFLLTEPKAFQDCALERTWK